MKLESHVKHEDPEIMSISHIHVLLLSCAISLIVFVVLPSSSPVLTHSGGRAGVMAPLGFGEGGGGGGGGVEA